MKNIRGRLFLAGLTMIALFGIGSLIIDLVYDLDTFAVPGEYRTIKTHTASIKHQTRGKILAIASNGDGRFIVSSSNTSEVREGDRWEARGLGSIYWGRSIVRSAKTREEPSETPSRKGTGSGNLKYKIKIPNINIAKIAVVSGYLLVSSTVAIEVDSGNFVNTGSEVRSCDFCFYLFPSCMKIYIVLLRSFGLVLIIGIILISLMYLLIRKKVSKGHAG
jgi:hypothetical protein